MSKRLVVMSVDSLFTSDLEKVKDKAGFAEVLSDCIVIPNLTCIYPTLTYPCHTTMITGRYPASHGIIHNEILNPSTNNAAWYWQYEAIQTPTLFDIVKKNGLTTAALSWPVTANGPIDHCIPEIWTLTYDRENQDLYRNASKTGKEVYLRHKHLLEYKENPWFDMFMEACALDIIENETPDVLLIHQASLDHERHVNGIQDPKVDEALVNHGYWIKNIIEAYKRKGIFEETTFVILGDHGQLNIKRVVSLNEMLRRAGLIKTDGLGHVLDYRAYAQSAGISCHIYVKDEKDIAKVDEVLARAKEAGYIEQIFDSSAMQKMGLVGKMHYAVEACPYVSFSNEVDTDILCEFNEADYKNSLATHGHLPTKGDRPPMLIYNSKRKATTIEGGRLVDFLPTWLTLLDLDIPDGLDGQSLL